MAGNTELRRQKLFDDALIAARIVAESEGLAGLTARRIASDIGCSVGTLYNVFDNLDTLILHLNGGTFDALYDELAGLEPVADAEMAVRGVTDAYLHFVRNNANLWNVVFEHVWPAGHPIPDWYMGKTRRIMSVLVAALAPLLPGTSEEHRYQAATVLWGGLHGIYSLAAAGKLGIVTTDSVEGLAETLVETFLAGLVATATGQK